MASLASSYRLGHVGSPKASPALPPVKFRNPWPGTAQWRMPTKSSPFFFLLEGSVRVWGVGQFGITAAYEFYVIFVFLEYMNSPLHASVIYLFIFNEMGMTIIPVS